MKKKVQKQLVELLKKEYNLKPTVDKVDDSILVDVSKNNVGVYAAIDDSKIEILKTSDFIEDYTLVNTYPIFTVVDLVAEVMNKLLG
jgi:hypothetical protein